MRPTIRTRGFHLREYSVRELRGILRNAGFPEVQVFVGARGYFARCPAWLVEGLETALEALPVRLRRRIADNKVLRALLGVRLAAIKGER